MHNVIAGNTNNSLIPLKKYLFCYYIKVALHEEYLHVM